jgi:hypothetical protein
VPGALICYDFHFQIEESEGRMKMAGQARFATAEDLVACFEDPEEQSPQVPDLPNGIPPRDVIRRALCAMAVGPFGWFRAGFYGILIHGLAFISGSPGGCWETRSS